MRTRLLGSFVLSVGLALATMASAQPASDAFQAPDTTAPPPLTISYVDGRVDVVRPDGVQAAQAPDLLEEDDRLVVGEGRAELVLDDGSVVHVDRATDLRVDRGVRLRLVSGRIAVHTAADPDSLIVATPTGLVRLTERGTYDLAADDLRGDTAVTVHAGHATLTTIDGETPIDADTLLLIDPRDRRPRLTRADRPDAFLDWSDRQMQQNAAVAQPGLPAAIQPWSGDLAVHGQWTTMAPYGPVWFPSAGVSWRPYQYGSWRYTRYGWTWIDEARWSWPLHHYGRWGQHAARGWYWIPERAWGPAWVGWAVAADHVAWAPLGWNRRPLIEFAAGARIGPVGMFASTWSILPRRAFGQRGPIHRDLADPRYLPGPVLGGFVSQMIGPRGPAGAGDHFAVRRGRELPAPPRPAARGYSTSAPPIAYQPRGGAAPRPERPPDAQANRRRPMDAPPPVDPAPAATAPAPAASPRERVWSSAPGHGSTEEPPATGRGTREVAPQRIPNRAPRPEAGASSAPSSPPPERGSGRSWGAPRPSPGAEGAGAPGGSQARPRGGAERRAPQGGSEGGRGNGAGRGAGGGAGSGGGQGGVRRRG